MFYYDFWDILILTKKKSHTDIQYIMYMWTFIYKKNRGTALTGHDIHRDILLAKVVHMGLTPTIRSRKSHFVVMPS